MRMHEAKLQAVMLRASRADQVIGKPGAAKSSLLCTGVLPLRKRPANPS
jgi:hypothetical protein